LALLDRNPAVRTSIKGNGAWVVALNGGLLVRYVRIVDSQLYVADEATWGDPSRWLAIPPGRNILDVVRARIVWFGREIQEEPSGSFDASGVCD
jgi:hypothetical protein